MGWPEGLPGVQYQSRLASNSIQPSNQFPDLSNLSSRLRCALGLTNSGGLTRHKLGAARPGLLRDAENV